MTMNFIIRYNGNDQPDPALVRKTLQTHQCRVLDDTLFPRALLVCMDKTAAEAVAGDLEEGWEISPEIAYRVPGTRRKIR